MRGDGSAPDFDHSDLTKRGSKVICSAHVPCHMLIWLFCNKTNWSFMPAHLAGHLYQHIWLVLGVVVQLSGRKSYDDDILCTVGCDTDLKNISSDVGVFLLF